MKDNLDKAVKEAKKAGEDYQKQIDQLRDDKYHDQIKDEKDRNTLQKTRGERDALKKDVSDLKQKVIDKDVEIASLNSKIDGLDKTAIKQQVTIAHLKVELDIQKSKNDKLFKRNGELIASQKKLEASQKDLQRQLAGSNDSVGHLQKQLDEANKKIATLTKEKEDAETRTKSAEKKLAALKEILG